MASTNKTTNYDLSQYIGTDKPTYLVDYNQDMAKIDAGITGAKSVADANAVNIGNLEDLSTTAKTDLVSAINEVDSDLSDLTSDVGDNTTDIGTLQGDLGNKANLNTTNKNNIVSAINEVNSNIGNLTNLDTDAKSNLVSAVNELVSIVDKFNLVNIINLTKDDMSGNPYGEGNGLTCAFNSDYSVCKIYGTLTGVTGSGTTFTYLTNNAVIPAQYRPTSDIIVNPCGFSEFSHSTNYYNKVVYLTIRADGKISVTINKGTNADGEMTTTVIPFIIFLKDFGDVPIPL